MDQQQARIDRLKAALAEVAMVVTSGDWPLGFLTPYYDQKSFLENIADLMPTQTRDEMETVVDVMVAEFNARPLYERRDSANNPY